MVEKTITLENISLVDFLGAGNQHIRQLSAAFPGSKIISRGNEIKLQGPTPVVTRIAEILASLIEHYHQFGNITDQQVESLIASESEADALRQTQGAPDVILYGARGGVIRAKTPNQQRLVDAILNHDLVFALGPAGTGKTFISVAMAVRALKNKEVRRIIISRPVVEAGENLGFLPGDMKEKVDPYIRPIYDALEELLPPEKLTAYYANKTIEIAPLAYMRGRTLDGAFVLLDEAQNTTPSQIKMFLTRMGPNAKILVNGDRSQIDLPHRQKSGLVEALEVLQGVKGIGFVELTADDVVRHRLVKDIVLAYDRFNQHPDHQGDDERNQDGVGRLPRNPRRY